jgi:DNA repair ATPase RecN
MSEAMRETVATVALQQRLRKSIAELEKLDPQNSLMSEYRKLNARALPELRRIRRRVELVLRRANLTPAQRKDVTEQLHLISLVESEFASGVDTAH